MPDFINDSCSFSRLFDYAALVKGIRAEFKLRFDQNGHMAWMNFFHQRSEYRQTGNKRNIHTGKIDRLIKPVGFNISCVYAFSFDHPFVFFQNRVQLQMTDIQGIHLLCSMIKSALGKAAGACSDIADHLILNLNIPLIESGLQFSSCPADK